MRYFWIKFRGDSKAWPVFKEATTTMQWFCLPSEAAMLQEAPVLWRMQNSKPNRTPESYRWIDIQVTGWQEFSSELDYRTFIGKSENEQVS